MDLPIEDTMPAKRQWDALIGLLIDWAETTYDPFSTNENPDLMPTIQELWNGIFSSEDSADGCLDVTKYPAIKKIKSVHPPYSSDTIVSHEWAWYRHATDSTHGAVILENVGSILWNSFSKCQSTSGIKWPGRHS